MSLIVNSEKTKNFIPKKNETIIFFKIFDFIKNDKEHIYSPSQHFKVKLNHLDLITTNEDLEINFDKFYSINYNKKGIIIDSGCFHAYVTFNPNDVNIFRISVPIHVKAFDVISFGDDDDVCFWKYKIPQSSWNHVLKQRLKYDEICQ